AQGGVPVLPSALEVLQTKSGQLQVLVSSQGSDKIFVFASLGGLAGPPTGVTPPPGGGGSGGLGGGAPPVPPAPRTPATTTVLPLGPLSATNGPSPRRASPAVAVLSAALGSSPSISPGTFAADSGRSQASGTASLAPVQGNTYATVAVLDSGTAGDEEAGD